MRRIAWRLDDDTRGVERVIPGYAAGNRRDPRQEICKDIHETCSVGPRAALAFG
jgi:hypothetical protein